MGNPGVAKLPTAEKSVSRNRNLEAICGSNSTMSLAKQLIENHLPTNHLDSIHSPVLIKKLTSRSFPKLKVRITKTRSSLIPQCV
jgi:hypothetical protein